MSGFYERMREAQLRKLHMRNRGMSIGKRGTFTRKPENVPKLEQGIARLVWRQFRAWEGFASDLDRIVLEINDPTIIECPF
jgi:hypothetical protein